ncbi:hypothetical protein VE01_10254 [Pseudogymnoascus verrucosus]|uniref:F-box domain-containing protein n=1 Tax=Pseudogymnoascus verrucosus TaxID=342668 RepID=A0A1B8G7A3_9PEZI|nr:uncharacterized protein VE01_10254 [Pseudogymnoascus verrucosus]OBT91704.1 hypothetical protein VE01_10254 [Pseudogymnoascus verrucosus]
MGEVFYITAPRAKRMLRSSDELQNIFFDNKASELVTLLVVPTRVKKQSQKQSQNQAVSPSAASTASAATTNAQSGRLDLSPSQKAVVVSQKLTDATAATRNPLDTFSTLPLDILSMIFDHLDDIADLTCVALATPYLWDVTQRTIHQRYKAKLGKWAGEAIVCVGEKIPAGDYPPDLFSPDEVERLNKEADVYFGGGCGRFLARPQKSPRTLANLAYPPNGTFDREGITADAEASRVFYACLRRCSRYPSTELRARLRRWIYTDRPDFAPREEDWILRNLTMKEFVTAEGIALDTDFINGPFISGIGFGDAVVARTLWTAKGTPDLRYVPQIGRGIWAGHRFDITTRSGHDEATKDEEWRDVSEEVASEIAGIWGSQFGPHWLDVGHFYQRFYEENESERIYADIWDEHLDQ